MDATNSNVMPPNSPIQGLGADLKAEFDLAVLEGKIAEAGNLNPLFEAETSSAVRNEWSYKNGRRIAMGGKSKTGMNMMVASLMLATINASHELNNNIVIRPQTESAYNGNSLGLRGHSEGPRNTKGIAAKRVARKAKKKMRKLSRK